MSRPELPWPSRVASPGPFFGKLEKEEHALAPQDAIHAFYKSRVSIKNNKKMAALETCPFNQKVRLGTAPQLPNRSLPLSRLVLTAESQAWRTRWSFLKDFPPVYCLEKRHLLRVLLIISVGLPPRGQRSSFNSCSTTQFSLIIVQQNQTQV